MIKKKKMGRPAKQEKSATVTFILPLVLKKQLMALAENAELTLSKYICDYLKKSI